VLIETEGFTEGKVGGEIVEVIMDEKTWRKLAYWLVIFDVVADCRPEEFKRKEESSEEEDEAEEQRVGEETASP
jgi:hypothetical protein